MLSSVIIKCQVGRYVGRSFLVRSCLLVTLIKCPKGHKCVGSLCRLVKTLIISSVTQTDKEWSWSWSRNVLRGQYGPAAYWHWMELGTGGVGRRCRQAANATLIGSLTCHCFFLPPPSLSRASREIRGVPAAKTKIFSACKIVSGPAHSKDWENAGNVRLAFSRWEHWNSPSRIPMKTVELCPRTVIKASNLDPSSS